MRRQGPRRVGDGACLLKLEEREVRYPVNGNTGVHIPCESENKRMTFEDLIEFWGNMMKDAFV